MVVPAAVNASNQLPGIAGGAAFTYEATGDLTSDGTRTDTYDAEGDLHILTATGPGLVASYRYDPFGRRYSKTVNGVTTVYDDDPEGRVIADYDGSGHVLRLYGYLGAATAPAVVMTPTGAMNGDNPVMSLVYNHVDRLGSVVATTTNGALAGSFSYTPWGEDPGDPELTGTEFGFDGYQFDAETGLYHTQPRYYDPRLGRFLSPDPLGQAAGRNVYAYVQDDPLDGTDPSGKCYPVCTLLAGIAISEAAAYFSDPQHFTWQTAAAAAGVGLLSRLVPIAATTVEAEGAAAVGVNLGTNFVAGSAGGLAGQLANGQPINVRQDLLLGGAATLAPVLLTSR